MNGKCLVVGDIMLDRYLYGSVSRISPEAPVPIVNIVRETAQLGGAANLAANLRGLELEVILGGIIGSDYEGETLCGLMQKYSIDFQGLIGKRKTTVKTRIIGQAQQIVRIDKEDTEELTSEEEMELIRNLQCCVNDVDYIIISDYKKGVCTERFCQYFIDMAHKMDKRVMVDPKQTDWGRYRNADIIKPNFGEFCVAAGKNFANTEKEIAKSAVVLIQEYSLQNLLVTRSQDGMMLVGADGSVCSFEAVQQEVYDVSGAGDTVLAGLVAGLVWKCSLEEAVRIANMAAGIAVSRRGTYIVKKQELWELYQGSIQMEKKDLAISWIELSQKLQTWKRLHKKIVFTNGCFDILHRGHVDYLQKAKALGDILIIGLNSDASVRRLKGEKRPVNNVQDRIIILKSLTFVDEVVVFEEDTPYELIRIVQPDILVKGGDYKAEDVVGKEFAGEVKILPFVEGYSTSRILGKDREYSENMLQTINEQI